MNNTGNYFLPCFTIMASTTFGRTPSIDQMATEPLTIEQSESEKALAILHETRWEAWTAVIPERIGS